MTTTQWARSGAALFAAVMTLAAVDAHGAKRLVSTISLNPIELPNGLLGFEYERAVFDNLSVHAGLNFLVDEALNPNDAISAYAIGPEAGLRFFLAGTAPQGLWLGPFAGISYVSGKKDLERRGDIGFSAGAMAGATMIFFDDMIVSAGAGLGYLDLSTQVGGERAGMRGWSPRFRLSAGFAF